MKLFPIYPTGRHAKASWIFVLALLQLSGCSWREEKSTLYPNGQVKIRWHERMIGPYRTVKDGPFESFYPTGARLVSGEFKNGDSVGLWEEWYLYGGPRSEKTYGPNGKLRGRSVSWMPNGDTVELHTYNESGELDGRRVVFWPGTGDIRQQGDYRNGKRDGLWQAWYRNGRVQNEREYDQGRFVGTWIEYGPDGNVASKREYMRNLPPELAGEWERSLVEGVPTGTSLDFQRRARQVDTIPSEKLVYGSLMKVGREWIVPFRWYSPRFEIFYKPRYDTLHILNSSQQQRRKVN